MTARHRSIPGILALGLALRPRLRLSHDLQDVLRSGIRRVASVRSVGPVGADPGEREVPGVRWIRWTLNQGFARSAAILYT